MVDLWITIIFKTGNGKRGKCPSCQWIQYLSGGGSKPSWPNQVRIELGRHKNDISVKALPNNMTVTDFTTSTSADKLFYQIFWLFWALRCLSCGPNASSTVSQLPSTATETVHWLNSKCIMCEHTKLVENTELTEGSQDASFNRYLVGFVCLKLITISTGEWITTYLEHSLRYQLRLDLSWGPRGDGMCHEVLHLLWSSSSQKACSVRSVQSIYECIFCSSNCLNVCDIKWNIIQVAYSWIKV